VSEWNRVLRKGKEPRFAALALVGGFALFALISSYVGK
jgi:hypothetical protein